MRRLLTTVRGLAWVLVATAVLVGSVAYHLTLPTTWNAIAHGVSELVSGEIQGKLRIGRIDLLSLHKVVVSEVEIFDPKGTRVIVAHRAVIYPTLATLLRGEVVIREASIDGAVLRLIPNAEGLPTFLDAFEPKQSSGTPNTVHVSLPSITGKNIMAYGDVPGVVGLRARATTVHASVDVLEEFLLRFQKGEVHVDSPYPYPVDLHEVTGTVSSDGHVGIHVHTRADLGPNGGPPGRAEVDVKYAVPQSEPALTGVKRLNLHVAADPLSAAHLRDAGFAWASKLKGTFRGTLDLVGPADRLILTADLVTDGGPVKLTGEIADAKLRIAATTTGLALARIVEGSPETTLTGDVSFEIDGAGPTATQRVYVKMKPFSIAGYAVPAVELSGTLLEDRIRLDSVDAKVGGGQVSITGTATFEGDVDAHIVGRVADLGRDPNFRKLVPNTHGAAAMDVHLRVQNGAFQVSGKATLTRASQGTMRAEKIVVTGSMAATDGALTVDAKADIQDLMVANIPMKTVNVTAKGSDVDGYLIHISLTASGERSLVADARVKLRDKHIFVESDRVVVRARTKTWTGHIHGLDVVPDSRIVLGEALLASDPEMIRANGTYEMAGVLDAHAVVRDLNIEALTNLLGQPAPPISGTINSELWVSGTRAKPTLRLEASLKDATFEGLKRIGAAAVLSYDEGMLNVEAQADVNGRGTATLGGTVAIDAGSPALGEALDGALFDLNMRVDGLDAKLLRRVKRVQGVVTRGEITGQLHFAGALFAPELDGQLTIPEVTLKDWPTLHIDTFVHYHNSYLVARIAAKDEDGELAEAEGSLLLDLANFINSPKEAIASLESLPWHLAVRVPDRAVRDMPQPVQSRLPAVAKEMRAAMSATFSGGAFKTRGNVTASIAWDNASVIGTCSDATNAVALIEANLADDVTIARMFTIVDGQPMFNLEATAHTPINQWIGEAKIPEPPPTSMKLYMHDVPLERVPFACKKAKGPLSAVVDIQDLFTQKAHGQIEISSSAIRMGRIESFAVNTTLALTPDELQGKAKFGWQSEVWGTADLSMPLRWKKRATIPTIDWDEATFALDFTNAPIEPFAGLVPQIDDGSGRISGVVEARGAPGTMIMSGEVRLEDAKFKLASTGQRLVNVNGNFILHSNWIELDQITAHDGRGELRIAGAVAFEGWTPDTAKVAVHAASFPLRHEGSELASLSGTASLKAEFKEAGTDLNVAFSQLAIKIPAASDRSAQPLDSHPDIHVRGEETDATDEVPYTVHVALDATKPFWVRRRDFGVQVAAEVDANYIDPDLFIAGYIEMKGGHFDVYGRTFNIDWGAINFDGSAGMDPSVNLAAVHRLRGGGTVTVTVSGTLTNPEIAFSSTEATDPGEIVSLLITGRAGHTSDTGGAEQQTANFVGGFLSGVLTLTLREAFGNYIPELTFDSNGLRAGQQLDFLIPKPLRSVVLGVYFEGQLAQDTSGSGGTQTTSNTSQTTSSNQLLLELQFPYDFFFEGTWAPPDRWRLDILWEP